MFFSPCRTIVQVGGSMYRLGVRWLNASVPFLLHSLIRFGAVIFRHTVISVGCSQFHSVDQRLGRWLLAHQHRTGLSTFLYTHEFLAERTGCPAKHRHRSLGHPTGEEAGGFWVREGETP